MSDLDKNHGHLDHGDLVMLATILAQGIAVIERGAGYNPIGITADKPELNAAMQALLDAARKKINDATPRRVEIHDVSKSQH